MKVRFLSIAEQELSDAFEWYEREKEGLGYLLIDEISKTIRRMALYPESCAVMHDGIRRALVNRFPYGIWYAIEEDVLIVYAVAHMHRRPRHWARR